VLKPASNAAPQASLFQHEGHEASQAHQGLRALRVLGELRV